MTGPDGITRRLLRLTQYGTWIADCRTVEELGRHLDVGFGVTAIASSDVWAVDTRSASTTRIRR